MTRAHLSIIADGIGRELRRRRSALMQEDRLHDAVALALDAALLRYEREYRLGESERLDFLLTDHAVAIEVKKHNAGLDVWRQVTRYLGHDAVAGAIVIAPRVDDIGQDTLAGKPIWPLPFWKYLF